MLLGICDMPGPPSPCAHHSVPDQHSPTAPSPSLSPWSGRAPPQPPSAMQGWGWALPAAACCASPERPWGAWPARRRARCTSCRRVPRAGRASKLRQWRDWVCVCIFRRRLHSRSSRRPFFLAAHLHRPSLCCRCCTGCGAASQVPGPWDRRRAGGGQLVLRGSTRATMFLPMHCCLAPRVPTHACRTTCPALHAP